MIHSDNPFGPDPSEPDTGRRLRGRLAAPVTILTSGRGDSATGLTVSSLFIVEDEVAMVHAVVGPTSDLWHAVRDTGRFVLHICEIEHAHLAEVFAGLRPSPGGLFADGDSTETDWGPVIAELPNRAFCEVEDQIEAGYAGIVRGRVVDNELDDLTSPLIHFRGRYGTVGAL